MPLNTLSNMFEWIKTIFFKKETGTGYTLVKSIIDKLDVSYLLCLWRYSEFHNVKEFFLKNDKIRANIKESLKNLTTEPENYALIDYTYVIEDSAIHTYHRDYTSSRRFNNLNFPSFTMILYLDESDTGLNLVPGSHLDYYPIYLNPNKGKHITFSPGDAVIFDADTVHAGSVVSTLVKRHCIQFKIIHKDDIQKLPHLLGYHVKINRPNTKYTIFKYIEAFLTMHFPCFNDIFLSLYKRCIC